MQQAMDEDDLTMAEEVMLEVAAHSFRSGVNRAVVNLRAKEMHDAADEVLKIKAS